MSASATRQPFPAPYRTAINLRRPATLARSVFISMASEQCDPERIPDHQGSGKGVALAHSGRLEPDSLRRPKGDSRKQR